MNAKLDLNSLDLFQAYGDLGNEKRIMLVAVQRLGLYLTFASENLKNDKEVVLTAVKQNGAAFKCASKRIQQDPEIMLIAAQNRGNSFSDEEIFKLKTLLGNLSFKENILKKPEDIDMRFRINKPEEWPYCLFGFIESQNYEGSGVLVGPNLVLTAAHVVYDNKNNTEEPVSSIFFSPGRNGDQIPYGKVGVTGIVYPSTYQTKNDLPHGDDWALLILEKDIGNDIAKKKNKAGWFQLKALENHEFENHPISITGYPGKKNRTLYEIKGNVHEIQKDLIGYKLDTSSGQSGGGVWTEIDGNKYLTAVHQCWTGLENKNWATRWTLDKHRVYERITLLGINSLTIQFPNLKITTHPNVKIFSNSSIKFDFLTTKPSQKLKDTTTEDTFDFNSDQEKPNQLLTQNLDVSDQQKVMPKTKKVMPITLLDLSKISGINENKMNELFKQNPYITHLIMFKDVVNPDLDNLNMLPNLYIIKFIRVQKFDRQCSQKVEKFHQYSFFELILLRR